MMQLNTHVRIFLKVINGNGELVQGEFLIWIDQSNNSQKFKNFEALRWYNDKICRD